MFKRIFTAIICFVLAATMLCGCSFFSHDSDRDLQQVIATVGEYEIKTSVTVDDGEDEEGNKKTHTVTYTYRTLPVNIYKRDLAEYVSNNSSTLSSQYGDDYEGAYRYAVRMLASVEVIVNEIEALIDAGEVDWYTGKFPAATIKNNDYTQYNSVKKQIYSVIDNTLMTIKNEILSERDKPATSTTGDSDVSESTTYPVKPDEESDDKVVETEEWQPSKSRYPGLSGSDDDQSLGREAMRRFINLLKDRVEDDFRVTDEERAAFEEDDKKIQEIIDAKGLPYVYEIIGKTNYVYYISGKNIERSLKITALQDYLTDNITVSDEEVQQAYTALLNEQKSSFSATPSAYDTAMSGGSTVLYHLNSNYFYVKHILLPFSDEQKAALTEYKERLNVTEEQIEAFRANLVDGIVCYPHVAGEDDMSRPMTVADVLNDVKATMKKLESSVTAADNAFDDLIYLYNTDSGAFDNNKGYIVKYELADGESETYMQEFADGARYMYDNLAVGQVYYEPVITDYGVHIMYFASKVEPGVVGINDYTTPGKLETYFDVLKEPIKTARENAAYTKWENEKLTYNYNKYVEVFEDRFSDLWQS